jgi:hypothetical protein
MNLFNYLLLNSLILDSKKFILGYYCILETFKNQKIQEMIYYYFIVIYLFYYYLIQKFLFFHFKNYQIYLFVRISFALNQFK